MCKAILSPWHRQDVPPSLPENALGRFPVPNVYFHILDPDTGFNIPTCSIPSIHARKCQTLADHAPPTMAVENVKWLEQVFRVEKRTLAPISLIALTRERFIACYTV